MSESDETSAARSRPSGRDEAREEGGAARSAWRERAAFGVSIDYSTDASGALAWRTRAYHEESDTRAAWPGVPGDELIRWLVAIAELPAGEAPAAAAEHDPPPDDAIAELPAGEAPAATEHDPPPDDLKQIDGIGAAIERRLHDAGICSYAQLAERTPDELGTLIGIPAKRIVRHDWITRARTLAGASEKGAEQERPAQAPATLHIQVCFDEDGEVFEPRILRDDAPPAPPIGREGARAAHFFVEHSAAPGASPGVLPGELEIEVEPLQLEVLPPSGGVPRLRARSGFRLSGIGRPEAGASYAVYVLAYDLASGETKVLQSVAGQLGSPAGDEAVEAEFDMPEVGLYRMLVAVLLADYGAVGAAAGARLRVNP